MTIIGLGPASSTTSYKEKNYQGATNSAKYLRHIETNLKSGLAFELGIMLAASMKYCCNAGLVTLTTKRMLQIHAEVQTLCSLIKATVPEMESA